ncbi:endonuclease [Caerostris extrusa]|uniref:Endonuclease n=1 Tax=Caerostris extrusa TaxID=172846 RepID=A0AAV4V1K7_CAEEX|nr:endonuclease [Caerostris extrusa]
MSTPSCMREVLLMTLMVEVVSVNMRKRVRCLLDCGSQRSYILRSTAEALHLKSLSSEKLTHSLFGGARTESKNHKRYSMRLRPVGRSTGYQFDFLDQDIICGVIPRIPKGPLLKEFKGHRIWISDMGDDYPEIELLIGSDIYGQILTGEVIQLNEGLTAINTKLGWTLCGEPKELNVQNLAGAQSMLITSLHVQNMKASEMWDLERIGITYEVQTFSKAVEDQLVQEQFLKGLSRYEDGRYCLLHAFYVDNCVTSVDTNVELEVFIQQATAIMADAKMELRMWTFGPEQKLSLQNVEPISPVLGVKSSGHSISRLYTQHLWQYGWREGLEHSPEAWPKSEFSPNEELIAAEMKKKIIVDLSVKIEKPEWFERFSSFSKIVRVICWMIRFVNKLRKKPLMVLKTLTVEEKTKSEIILWSIEQKKHFQEKENSVHGLQVVLGDDDVLRVKTRIIERDDDLSFLYPILLPSKHYLTECLRHLKPGLAFLRSVLRAIHLESLTSLSTESFMQALRRFIAQRDRPSKVYTDNALKKIDWQKISENECYPIKWKFNPTAAWWWWGWWERAVKSLLVRILEKIINEFS